MTVTNIHLIYYDIERGSTDTHGMTLSAVVLTPHRGR